VAELRVWTQTADYDASYAFYGKGLGLEVHDEWDGPDGRGALFALAGGLVEVTEAAPGTRPDAVRPRHVALSAEVDDAVACHDRVVAAGIPVAEPLAVQPWGHRSFAIVDPNGLRLVFFEKLGTGHP
jgi:catechol 2,3-dioxygenase-like lactoylglutathione lyase family enzyme